MKADEGIGQAEVRHAQIWVQAQCLMERAGRFNPNIRMHVRKPLVIKRLGFARMRGHFFVVFANPVAIRTGIGKVHEKESTHSSEAPPFYKQGVSYITSHFWIEAARFCHQALRLVPNE